MRAPVLVCSVWGMGYGLWGVPDEESVKSGAGVIVFTAHREAWVRVWLCRRMSMLKYDVDEKLQKIENIE